MICLNCGKRIRPTIRPTNELWPYIHIDSRIFRCDGVPKSANGFEQAKKAINLEDYVK